jgi:glycosidase
MRPRLPTTLVVVPVPVPVLVPVLVVVVAVALAVVAGASCASTPTARPPAEAPATAAAPAAPAAPIFDSWANGAVFYEVFVRSFADTNGDGKGDLAGLIARLDYLNDGNPATDTDLGVDALWLMPVFASPSYHGYDTTDYDTINPDYGTNEDFTRLCTEAHRRGMKVIVDLVLNHTSNKHPWFQASASSPTSDKRDWYVWSPSDLGWGQPWNPSGPTWHSKNGAFYYGVFWSGMPDLNFKNLEVRAEAKRIAAEWLDRGVDGFRLDATRHLIETGPGPTGQSDTDETHAFLKEFSAFVRKTKPEAVLIGENWTETDIIAKYYGDTSAVPGGDELPLSFSFPLAAKIIAGARQGEASLVADKIAEMQKVYPPGATWVPFLTNHDMQRVASNLKNEAGQLRTAAAILLTLPGTPFIYYGEEIGMQNGPGDDDEWKRTPMPWDGTKTHGFTTGKPWQSFAPGSDKANVAAETQDPASLLSHYRRLVRLRHASRALQRGRLELLTTEGPILVYTLTEGKDRVLVAHNLGSELSGVAVKVTGPATPLLVPEGARLDGGHITLAGHDSAAWRL